MKITCAIFLLSALLIVSSWGAPSDDKGNQKDTVWGEFKSKHNKRYTTGAKESKARANFDSNDAKIKKHNAAHAAGNISWFMNHNEFSDMTKDEFAQAMLSKLAPTNSSFAGAEILPLIKSNQTAETRQLVATVDYSVVRYMGVRNQGVCGSCYAFATIGLLEWYHSYKYGGSPDFSEQQVVSCSKAYNNNGCGGGSIDNTVRYLQAYGIAAEWNYPYEQTFTTAVSGCRYWSSMRAASLGNVYGYASFLQLTNDEGLHNAMISAKGPIAMGIHVNDDWHLYGGAVYDSYCSGGRNHAVMIAGYGYKDGKPYWHVKNSWGSSWGANGFMYLLRGVNQCSVGTDYAWWPTIL